MGRKTDFEKESISGKSRRSSLHVEKVKTERPSLKRLIYVNGKSGRRTGFDKQSKFMDVRHESN